MPCYHPIPAWWGPGLTKNGKRNIVFDPSKGLYLAPSPACGQCIGCRLDRSQQWANRIMHEVTQHTENSFITATYSDEHLPWDGSLVREHLYKFQRDLRNYARRSQKKEIRLYSVGEYGEQLSRPHWHLIVFNLDFPDKELVSDIEGIRNYDSEILSGIWGKGFVSTGSVDYESAAYVARYCMKKITGKQAEDHYTKTHPLTGEIIKLEPEFNVMSRRPGIGKGWYESFTSDLYPSGFMIRKGSRIKIPRYYDTLFQKEDPEAFEAIKKQRIMRARAVKHDSTPERLAVREKHKTLTIQRLKRNLRDF